MLSGFRIKRGMTKEHMILIIDISNQPALILKKDRKIIARHSWPGLYDPPRSKAGLDETLLIEIDKFLKKNKVRLKEIKGVKVKPNKKSMVSTRIAKAVALGLTSYHNPEA
jgi:tRNA A37 threonylcarbamoyladenosine modification protein TsaB